MKNGLLVPTSNPDKLAEAINLLISDHQLRLELGIQAGITIKEHFDIGTMTRNVEAVYDDEIANKIL